MFASFKQRRHSASAPLAMVDSNASAYVAAVLFYGGVTATDTQLGAINAFVIGEKAAGRWDLHKRFYLPIWGNAAANAICMKSLTSGTFVGGVTHGDGYVKSDGSTGYFDFGIAPTALGLTVSPTYQGLLHSIALEANMPTTGSIYFVSSSSADSTNMSLHSTTTNLYGSIRSKTVALSSSRISKARASQAGVFVATRPDYTTAYAVHRTSAGYTYSTAQTGYETMNASTWRLRAMCNVNSANASVGFTTTRLGCFGASNGLSTIVTIAELSLALKTLWETCTGQLLP